MGEIKYTCAKNVTEPQINDNSVLNPPPKSTTELTRRMFLLRRRKRRKKKDIPKKKIKKKKVEPTKTKQKNKCKEPTTHQYGVLTRTQTILLLHARFSLERSLTPGCQTLFSQPWNEGKKLPRWSILRACNILRANIISLNWLHRRQRPDDIWGRKLGRTRDL